MLSVSIHKDIGEYTEKIVGKLSFRTLACVVGGLGTAVAIAAFSYLALHIDVANVTLPVMLCSMPFWLAGFWRPCGMKAEEFIGLWWAHISSDGVLLHKSGFLVDCPDVAGRIAETPTRRARRAARRKGVECYEPTV